MPKRKEELSFEEKAKKCYFSFERWTHSYKTPRPNPPSEREINSTLTERREVSIA